MTKRSSVKTIIGSLAVLLILCIIGMGGYLAIQRLPAFYQAPTSTRRVEWDVLPQPLEVQSDWQTWTTAQDTTDAIWTNNLLWLATDGGVAVFDELTGKQVKFLTEHGLPSINISSIEIDPNGHIWVGTTDSGVARYDGGAWEKFGSEDGLPSGQIRDLYAAPDGVIWAATASGAARFDGNGWSLVRFSLLDLTRIDATSITGFGQSVWIGSQRGVYFFDGVEWTFQGLNEGLINEQVNELTIAPDRNVWVATPSGVGRFNGSRWDRFTVADGLPDLPVADILAAPDSSVWIYFEDLNKPKEAQVIRFDGMTVSEVYTGEINKLTSQNGRLWIATDSGLRDVSNPESVIVGKSDFPHQSLKEIIKTDGGLAVAGSSGLSFLQQDGNSSDWETIGVDPLGAVKQADDGRLAFAGHHPADGVRLLNSDGSEELISCDMPGVSAGKLYAIAESLNGEIWILGTDSVGRFSNGGWRYFLDGLPTDYTPRKVVADTEGNIWLGLAEGLFLFNPNAEVWELIDGRSVQRLTAGLNGSLWLIAENELLHYVENQFNRFPLPGLDGVSRGFVATEDGLWVSSADGIARLNQAGEWERFTIADGLSIDDVTTLTVDQDSTVWAGYGDTRFGVSKFVNGEWEIVHNVIDPDAPNNGHRTVNAPRRDEVVSIAVTAKEQIWLGTYFGDIGRISADELFYEPDDWRLYFSNMTAIHEALDGSVWFVGWGGRIARLLPENIMNGPEKWLIYDSRLSTAVVQDVIVQDGTAWLATNEGIAVIENEECRMVPHREDLNVVKGQINPVDDSIWWATSNNGGLQLDVESEKLDWPILQLRGRKFSDMILAPDDTLWFISNQVLIRVDGENERRQPLEEDIGEVRAVAIGADLRPWIATDQGVAIQNRGEWTRLTTAEGIATNELIDILVSDDGAVWLLSESAIVKSKN